MANSVMQDRQGPDWPLGFISVANNGTPVNIMVNVDPSNNNAPQTAATSTSATAEYTQRCHHIGLQGYHPAANNNGVTINTGNCYLMRYPTGNNAGNKSDYGAMVKVIPPGADLVYPEVEAGSADTISPYRYRVDAEVDGEGVIGVLWIG